jgi:hypothetical protein
MTKRNITITRDQAVRLLSGLQLYELLVKSRLMNNPLNMVDFLSASDFLPSEDENSLRRKLVSIAQE